jgi:hypothetical protein
VNAVRYSPAFLRGNLIQRYLVRIVEDGLRLEMAAYDNARARASADSGTAPVTHDMARDESDAPQVTLALAAAHQPSLSCYHLTLSCSLSPSA